jgi:hypothetical protein
VSTHAFSALIDQAENQVNNQWHQEAILNFAQATMVPVCAGWYSKWLVPVVLVGIRSGWHQWRFGENLSHFGKSANQAGYSRTLTLTRAPWGTGDAAGVRTGVKSRGAKWRVQNPCAAGDAPIPKLSSTSVFG